MDNQKLAIRGMNLSVEQIRFAIWLASPKDQRSPKTQKAIARDLGVHENTLVNWKSMPGFAEVVFNICIDIIKGRIPDLLHQMVDDAMNSNKAPGIVIHARDRILELTGVYKGNLRLPESHERTLENLILQLHD